MAETPDETALTERLLIDLPPRVARIETHIEYLRGDIAELKSAVIKLADAVPTEFKAVRAESAAEFKAVRAEMHAEFKFLLRLTIAMFGTLGTLMLGLGGMMAHGFHWIP